MTHPSGIHQSNCSDGRAELRPDVEPVFILRRLCTPGLPVPRRFIDAIVGHLVIHANVQRVPADGSDTGAVVCITRQHEARVPLPVVIARKLAERAIRSLVVHSLIVVPRDSSEVRVGSSLNPLTGQVTTGPNPGGLIKDALENEVVLAEGKNTSLLLQEGEIVSFLDLKLPLR